MSLVICTKSGHLHIEFITSKGASDLVAEKLVKFTAPRPMSLMSPSWIVLCTNFIGGQAPTPGFASLQGSAKSQCCPVAGTQPTINS